MACCTDDATLNMMRAQLWSFLESTTPMRRSRPETWNDSSYPGWPHLGLVSMRGIGQSDFMWSARTQPSVITAFETALGVPPGSPLLCSFDGAAVFRPAQLDPSSPLLFVTSMSATAPPTMSPTPAAETLSPIGIALIVVGGVVLCGGVALYIARRIKRARWNAAGPLGDFELSAVDEVPIAAVAVLDEEDSAGVWAAPATADPGSLSGVKTEMANGVPGVQL